METSDYLLSAAQSEAIVAVLNNDFPKLAIRANGDVVEGTDSQAEFTISVSTAPATDLIIPLNISQIGNFIIGEPVDSIILLADEVSVNFQLPIHNNDIEEADGQITVEIQPGEAYTLDTNSQSASVAISNDDIYFVSIHTDALEVIEGESINYIVELTNPAPSTGISLTISNIEASDYISDFEVLLNYSAGETEKTFSIQTSADDHYSADGIVTARVNPASNFSIQPGEGEVTTIVADDDAPGGISIIPITQSIVEGEIARFQITADHPTNFERAINIAITESGNYLSNQFKLPDFATIEAGQRTTIVEVETEADDIIESDGQINVRVLAGDNYVRANLHTNAAIQVRNEDQVTLSISALSTTVTEGLPVKLTILSTPVIPNQDLELNFVHDVAGEFLLAPPIQQIILSPSDFVGQEAQVVIAQTINDTTFEANGLISSELVASSDYHVADAPNNFTQYQFG